MRKNSYWFAAIAAMVVGFGMATGVRADAILNLGVPLGISGETVAPVTSDSINGAVFSRDATHTAGTGVVNPFLTIQMKGFEQGYNTDGGLELDDTRPAWNNDLALSSLQSVTLAGHTGSYYAFFLDVNQDNADKNGDKPDPFLSMTSFKIFQSDTPSRTDFNTTTLAFPSSPSASLIYNMDSNTVDYRVDINYQVSSSGSGTGDMFVYVPTSFFNAQKYVYLYTSFGNTDDNYPPYHSNAGFEEWWTLQVEGTPLIPVPLPQAAWLGIVLVGGIVGARKLRSRRNAVIA